jgi:hypothetical protein
MRLLSPNRLVTILSFLANSMASSRILPRLFYTLLSLLVALFLAACADPGTGGSGIPSSAGVGSPSNTSTNGVSNAPASPGAGNLSAMRVESLDSNSVTIGGVRYSASQIEVSLADSSVGNFASLIVGQAVLVTEVQATAGASTTRWKLTIQAQL